MPRALSWCLLALTLLFSAAPASASEAWVTEIDGPIGPAITDHVVRTLEAANDSGAEALILKMNTPGGLDQSMRDIISAILQSRVPVITYVAPRGSRAASAGTYILYASHIAAMAPATNLGAATPVSMGGDAPSLPFGDEESEPDAGADENGDSEGEKKASRPPPGSSDAMRSKVINDAKAYIRGLAELRGRNAEWAERAVTEAATLTAAAAAEKNVIDLVAEDERALLEAVSGRQVQIGESRVTLETANAELRIVDKDWRTSFLEVITNPNVAYILLMVGIYGLILEFSNPGIGAGGIIGAIALLVALYALQMLPISYSALGLLILGLGLMGAEAFSPSFGILGLGGVAAFIIGSIMLMDTDMPGFQIALPVILGFAVVSAVMLIVVLNLLLKSRHQPVVSGIPSLEGEEAEVADLHDGQPRVRLQGEMWQVRCDTPLQPGDRVRVKRARSLILEVEKEN